MASPPKLGAAKETSADVESGGGRLKKPPALEKQNAALVRSRKRFKTKQADLGRTREPSVKSLLHQNAVISRRERFPNIKTPNRLREK